MHRKMHMARRGCGGRSLPSSDLSRRSDPGTVVCRRKSAFSEGGWMDSNLNEWLNLVFRWIHVLGGVMWIGHLWFFNFVNAQLAKTYDPDSRKKVLPELLPRALYWFRWGAAYTWITGILLLFLVYWFGGTMVDPDKKMGPHAAGGIGLVLIVIGFVVYDVLWKTIKNEKAGAAISFVLTAVFAYVLTLFMSGRAMYIHVGALFGTIMAANVWMRIWP